MDLKKIIYIVVYFFLLTIPAGAQNFCSHHSRSEFVTSAVSPAYSELQDCYDVKYYNLYLEASDTSTFIKANTEIAFLSLKDIDTLVFELSYLTEIDSITVNDSPVVNYDHFDNLIYIFPENSLTNNTINQIRIWYEGGIMSAGFFSGISNRKDFQYQTNVTYTLSEPFQSSSWFPVKQNLEDKADSVRVTVVTDSTLMAGSNGLLKEKEYLENGKIKYKWESFYPIAYYLISIAVADYIDYSFYIPLNEASDSLLIQNFIYDHPDIIKNEKERIDKTGEMMNLFNELYGMYPFKHEKYGHSMAPMGGGMEHQTMTTLQTFNFDLVAHELAHQWFGNNVTCGTWQDIWINEGFASYSEYLAREFLLDKSQAIDWMENAHDIALREESGSVYLEEQESKSVSRIFSFPLSYKKGAAILHMLRYEIDNDDLFFKAFREFQMAFKDSVAVGNDFLEVVNRVTGEDYNWFFDQWYFGRGFPVLQATWRNRADSLFVQIYQGASSSYTEFFRMHIDLEVVFEDGTNNIFRILIDEPEEKFALGLDKKMIGIQLDPFRNNLMNSVLYEYIPEINSVELSPNPFTSSLFLDFINPNSSKSILISNLQGKTVYEETYESSGSMELNLSGLAPGIYLIVIKENGKTHARKIVKL